MDIELRPLSLGELLDRTFQIYRARFALFLGIAVVASVLETAWSLLQILETNQLVRRHISAPAIQATTSVTNILTWTVSFGVAGLAMAATNRAVTDIFESRPTGIRASYHQVRPHWFRYMWLNVATFLLAWGLFVVLLVATLIAVYTATRARTVPQATIVAGIYGGMGILMLFALPLCIWLTLRYALANSACITEGLGIRQALKRSVFLSKELRWRILVLLIVIFIAQSIFSIALIAPVFAIIVRHPGHVPVAVTAYMLLVGLAASALIKPIYSIGLTLFYYDARIRKEGYDVEWLLQHSSTEPVIVAPDPNTLGLIPG